MGRPRKPVSQHKADGTYRKDRHPDPDELPQVDPLDTSTPAPSFLGTHGKHEWSRLLTGMENAGLFTSIDYSALSIACWEIQVFRECLDALRKENGGSKVGAVAAYVTSHKSNNSLLLTQEARRAYRSYQEAVYKFGVTPLEREKIRVEKSKGEDDPFASLGNKKDGPRGVVNG